MAFPRKGRCPRGLEARGGGRDFGYSPGALEGPGRTPWGPGGYRRSRFYGPPAGGLWGPWGGPWSGRQRRPDPRNRP